MNRTWRWLADRLPRQLIYFAAIRLWASGTTGIYSDTEVPGLTVSDALRRWEDKELKARK